ncbi:MAG TPA: PAS domain-containing protein [Burkholderiaceae bacterium]|nr:PAS domain-containing protein [Burkholderiaceae bacterium]
MRIRTQLLVSAALACLLAALVVAASWYVTRQARTGLDDQSDAQGVAREVASLLVLTNEVALYDSARAAAQWRTHHAQLLADVDHAVQRHDPRLPELDHLRSNVVDLSVLFEALVAVSKEPETPLAQRRRQLLLERLLIETQEVVESRHRWALTVGLEQQRNQEIFQAMAVAAPAALLAILVSLAAVVGRRVLPPLARLRAAVTAIRGGDLTARCASDAADELGDAARAVDAMAEALQEREAALRTSERRLRLVADSLPALVSHIDTEERYTFANAHFRRFGAGDPEAMIGRTMREERGEELYRQLAPYVARALRGEAAEFETSRLVAGRPAHRQVSYVPDMDESGKARGFYAMTFDITARKEAELRLAASERHLRDLTNSIPALVAYFDMQECCQYANDLARRVLGAATGEATGITLRSALGEATYDAHRGRVAEALHGRPVRFEGKTESQGRELHFQAHLIPDLEADGTQRGFYVMTFDITALVDAQGRQAHVERQLRAITDNLPVLISYLDERERFQFANATYRTWLGIEPADLIGRTLAETVADPLHYEERRERLQQALSGERVCFELESVMLGIRRSLQVAYIPDRRADGTVAGVFALSSDITPMKQVEAKLSQLASLDPLTGLPNRRQFEDRIAVALAEVQVTGNALAVMFLDIDHFKSINDRLGHGAGDAVLKEFALRLRHTVRATDIAARLAGDEFVVLLEGVPSEHDAEVVAKKVLAAIREPFFCAGASLQVTTSVGVAFSAHPRAAGELLACADAALYEAKDAGRDTLRVRALGVVSLESRRDHAGEATRQRVPAA